MGSLLSGWDSPDPNAVKLKRNKSLTKEGIEAFWNLKKMEEEHLREISMMSPRSQEVSLEEASQSCVSIAKMKELVDLESQTSLDKLIEKNGWWISSNSAFLNEPPVISTEGNNQKYVAQIHISSKSTSCRGSGGIS